MTSMMPLRYGCFQRRGIRRGPNVETSTKATRRGIAIGMVLALLAVALWSANEDRVDAAATPQVAAAEFLGQIGDNPNLPPLEYAGGWFAKYNGIDGESQDAKRALHEIIPVVVCMKPYQVCTIETFQDGKAPLPGQEPEYFIRRKRDVKEKSDSRIGMLFTDQRRQQHQVIQSPNNI